MVSAEKPTATLKRRLWRARIVDESVAQTVQRFDRIVSAIASQRLAQRVEVGAQRVAIRKLRAPDCSFEFRAREDAAGRLHEHPQKVQALGRQPDRPTGPFD